MSKFNFTATAWLNQHYGPDDLRSGSDKGAYALVFFSEGSDMSKYGYTRVGPAEISVDMIDEKTLVENKVESLRAQKSLLLADTHVKATAFDRKIQNLLAIEYDGSAS